jgi:hypothetical protein
MRPIRGIFREHPQDERLELGRRLRAQVTEPRRLLEQDLGEHRHDMLSHERRPPRQALEEDAAEREDVGPRVEVPRTSRLLRGHVRRGSERNPRARDGRCALRSPRQAKVQNLDLIEPALDQEQVAGFEVAVNDAAPVRDTEGIRDRRDEPDALGDREPLAGETC